MNSAFNSDFYIAAATVIPVLYFALIVQADRVRDILTHLDQALYAKIKNESHTSITLIIITLGFMVAFIIWLASAAILILGIGGEIAAIVVLYQQSDSHDVRLFVLITTILLLAISIIGPALVVSTAFTRPQTRWAKALIHVLRTMHGASDSSDHKKSLTARCIIRQRLVNALITARHARNADHQG